jgi:hypothetical protein
MSRLLFCPCCCPLLLGAGDNNNGMMMTMAGDEVDCATASELAFAVA